MALTSLCKLSQKKTQKPAITNLKPICVSSSLSQTTVVILNHADEQHCTAKFHKTLKTFQVERTSETVDQLSSSYRKCSQLHITRHTIMALEKDVLSVLSDPLPNVSRKETASILKYLNTWKK